MERLRYCFCVNLTCTWFFCIFMVCSAADNVSGTANVTTDRSALLALKSSIISDPRNVLATHWSASSFHCNWMGVTCDNLTGRVKSLSLAYNDLQGIIPPHLGNLSFLVNLNLSGNNFEGNLPIEICQLRQLSVLDLGYNNFAGKIPQSIGQLYDIRYLILRNNSFSGAIPLSLSNMSKLEVLDLKFNAIGGAIPSELGKLDSLRSLLMSGNKLQGSIPSTIFNISSLERVILFDNALSGSIPEEIGYHLNLKNIVLEKTHLSGSIPSPIFNNSVLRQIHFGKNNFTGVLPSDICRGLPNLQMLYLHENNLHGQLPSSSWHLCSKLQILSLHGNKISGYIPRDIGNLTMLEWLSLGENHLQGFIPREIGNLQNLNQLVLGRNYLTGPIPSTIFNISSLTTLYLSWNALTGSLPLNAGSSINNLQMIAITFNNLTGEIPSSISNASNLNILELSGNLLSGVLPNSIGNLVNLRRLTLDSNNLTSDPKTPEISFLSYLTNCRMLTDLTLSFNPLNGRLPDTVGNLSTSLMYIELQNCEIHGRIPQEIGNLGSVIGILLNNNNLEGAIPTTFGGLRNLQQWNIGVNRLQGSVPQAICKLTNLVEMNISDNILSGSFPQCVGNLTTLRKLDISSNNFSSVPATLWRLKDLLQLNLSSNAFEGFLPSEISNLEVLSKLDLSRNLFGGSIPNTIGELQNLGFLDLSHNLLTGNIPQSLESLVNLQYFNVSYNKLEGEIPNSGVFLNFTPSSFMMNGALCGRPELGVRTCNKNSKHRKHRKHKISHLLRFIVPSIVAAFVVTSGAVFFVRKKRNLVDPSNNYLLDLGRGRRVSYFEVQQATNNFDESNLLGKGSYGTVFRGKLSDGMELAIKVFNSDIESISRSFETECEAMRNLRHRNLIKIISTCSNADMKALLMELMPNGNLDKWLHSQDHYLSFLQRLNIMIDVASALEYLHHGYSKPVAHCDLKPNNVLLDENMVAHVSDFGISKLLDGGQSMTYTTTLATIGYMAPEYGSRGIASTKGDVYSFGIMLMEVFTKKKPTDDMFVAPLTLKSWVKESVPHLTIQILDPNLLLEVEQYIDTIVQHVSFMMELALDCCADNPEERVLMADVLTSLTKNRSNFMKFLSGNE